MDRCVIVGASHAGAKLATSLRQFGWSGSITMIGDDPHLPYHRPPLSKDFLKGTKSVEDTPLNASKLYGNKNINLVVI